MIACMGGWCARRDKCPHYHSAETRNPAERLCPPGMDGEMLISAPGYARRAVPMLPLDRPLGTGEPL